MKIQIQIRKVASRKKIIEIHYESTWREYIESKRREKAHELAVHITSRKQTDRGDDADKVYKRLQRIVHPTIRNRISKFIR